MPTGRCLTGRSGHQHDTLATPRLHQLHSETWQLQSPELRFSTSSSPSLQPTAPDLPRKESVTSATNLDTGRANAQKTTRAKAGMAVGTKGQRMSSPHGSLLLLHLEHLKSSKPTERLSIGVQVASVGLRLTPLRRTLAVARKVQMGRMVVVLQSTMSPLLLIHRCGLRKLRSSQV